MSAFEWELGQYCMGPPPVGNFCADWATPGLRLLQEALMVRELLHYGGRFENDLFFFRPFVYDDESREPNFVHRASNARISWYKRIGRGMSSNLEYPPPAWERLVAECVLSIPEPKP